ncbi:unnamed protein product [Urochloa decumbens]|uniref:DUF1618 domain-containing protein n=1 Tax=Urochloa decumbens TaxID=240449 RepID=A0ABC8XPZ0_9POAL
MAASSSSAPALAPAPAPAPDPHWTILGRVALLQRTIGELVCVAVAKPPCASTLTVRTSALLELTDDGDDDSDKDRYVAAVAADADANSASLLHVSRCPLIGVDLDLDRPGTLLVATGFVPADASEHVYTTTDVVRLPDRTSPDGKPVTSSCIRSLGLISFPGSGGADYMVADLRLADGAKDLFSLLSFRSGTDAWVERQLSCPSMCGLSVLWSSDDVIAHDQKLWWMNFELGLLGCDVFFKDPGLEHVILPQTLTEGLLNIQSGGGILRTSQGKLRYVEIARPLTDPPQNTVITIWTLLDHFPWWEKRCSTNLGSIWSSRCYKDSKLPEEAPVIAFVHPQDPDAVFFLLQKFVFSVNVPQNRIVDLIEDPSVVGVLSGNTVLQPICWRYILSWELPPWLHTEHLSMPFDDFMALLESPTADHQV